MLISAFNYVCLKGCHPPKMQGSLHEGRLVKLLIFCLTGRKFDQPFFEGMLFVSFYKMAEFAVQQMLSCM